MVMGELAVQKDIVVLGSGPGGYVCALRLAQLGKKVTLVEKERLGGVCLNRGCIPSKALINFAHILESIDASKSIGINADVKNIDFSKTQKWKQAVVDKLVSGISYLMEKNKVEVVIGEAIFETSNRIKITGNEEFAAIEFNKCVIASGSRIRELPSIPFDGERIVGSKEALSFQKIPSSLIVIGGGYIGVELAGVYAAIGSKVTILEAGSRILPIVEEDLSKVVEKNLKEHDVEIITNVKAEGFEKTKDFIIINCTGSEKQKFEAEKVMVAIGRVPETKGLRLMNTKVQLDEHGFIKVNEQMLTTDSNIYAIGDVVGQPMLAHKAFRQGKVVAEVIAGQNSAFDNNVIPSVIFSEPEIALVGMSEEEAKKEGNEIVVGKFPFSALGKAMIIGEPHGFVKVIAEKKTHEILGFRIVGPNASDLIGEATVVIESAFLLEDVANTIHPHPTLNEALMESCEDALNASVHIYKK